ncbi:MAG: signal peptidase II [Defluviitaleaceae bacterium]|nr:signal peptidase II [Defluviitaleaceae bacterium]
MIYGLCAAILVTLDQLVKLWAIANLQGQPERPLIQGFLHLTYLENTGAAFGLLAGFSGAQLVLSVFKLIFMGLAIAYFALLPPETRFNFVRIPIVMIFAGGVGNLIDRVRFGFVVDMLAFRFIDFPIFNIADIYVTVGAFLFVFIVLFIVKDVPFFGASKTPEAVE